MIALSRQQRGIACALGCYTLWGFFPVYWKLLGQVSALEILAHRMFWGFVFVAVLVRFVVKVDVRAVLHERRTLLCLLAAALVCTVNWGMYIYAVTSGHLIQASMGYYINPLLSICLGVAFFRERLTILQKVGAISAAVGVLCFTFDYGALPWLSLVIAGTFALYGALKKKAACPPIPALAVETTAMLPLALMMIALTFVVPDIFGAPRGFLGDVSSLASWETTMLLAIGGVVTVVPLILFAVGVNEVPLSVMGFLQYVSPTITLLLGVFLYGEVFSLAHAICFGFIWAGLAVVSLDAFAAAYRRRQAGIRVLLEQRTCLGTASVSDGKRKK
ncbi:MAG: EamA family transporter RarD [Raoultibacter sp.]